MAIVNPATTSPFNPNDGETHGGFPVFDNITDIENYTRVFLDIGPTLFERWCTGQSEQIRASKSTAANALVTQKALALPPEMQSFARFSIVPEQQNGGVTEWPGIPPEALRKVVRENLAPQVIIGMRVDDVLRYSTRSTHPWKPGWRIKMRDGFEAPDGEVEKALKDAHAFLENCNIETVDARERDKMGYTDFATFLAQLTRDSLTFDGMSVWTDMDLKGRIKSFKTLSSYNIRLCLKPGYMGDPAIYAVGVDETGTVMETFTRDQLIFRIRNPRPDADIFGYGYSEVEQAVRLIQGFQNAMEMNADVFNRNSMPNGFLVIKGQMNQRQLDVLSRIWINLKRGVTKQWALPVIPVGEKGSIEVVDLHDLKGMDAMYQEYMNMVAGLFCAMYRFPPHRLGYKISGKVKESEPEVPVTAAPNQDDYDPYIAVLLQHIENLINQYILWTRWPYLQFEFEGKSPVEDARQYEAQVLACTIDERRALSDQKPMAESVKDADEQQKELLKLMGAAPVDPAMAGIYQSTIQAIYGKGGEGDDGTPGARMTSKKDPARSEDHGHTSGVRRNSAAESAKADVLGMLQAQIQTLADNQLQIVTAVEALQQVAHTLAAKP